MNVLAAVVVIVAVVGVAVGLGIWRRPFEMAVVGIIRVLAVRQRGIPGDNSLPS